MASKPRSRNAGFDGTNPFCKTTYICSNCGKRTRETGQSESGVGLCAKCFEEAGLENEHSDNGGHVVGPNWEVKDVYNPKCPTCRAMKEEGHVFADGSMESPKKKPSKKVKKNTFAEKLTPTKFCPHCKTDKPVTDFWKMKASKDGYQNWCKGCQLSG